MNSFENTVSKLVSNTKKFNDKEKQVSTDSLTVFGVAICSRYSKCNEMISMMRFCELAAISSVAHYVKAINFDSKACSCSFILDPTVTKASDIELELFSIAKKTISHFWWFDDEYFDFEDNE